MPWDCTLLSYSETWPAVIGKATIVLAPSTLAVAGLTGATETLFCLSTPAVGGSRVTWVSTPVSMAIVAAGVGAAGLAGAALAAVLAVELAVSALLRPQAAAPMARAVAATIAKLTGVD